MPIAQGNTFSGAIMLLVGQPLLLTETAFDGRACRAGSCGFDPGMYSTCVLLACGLRESNCRAELVRSTPAEEAATG